MRFIKQFFLMPVCNVKVCRESPEILRPKCVWLSVCVFARLYVCSQMSCCSRQECEIKFADCFKTSMQKSQCGINYEKRSGVNECGNASESSSHVVIRLLSDL